MRNTWPRGRQLAIDLLIGGLALTAVVVGALRLQRMLSAAPDEIEDVATIEDWRQYPVRGIRLGADDASATLVAFVDYECNVCARAAPYLQSLLSRYPERVSVVYRHYPLARRSSAVRSAKAALCAADMGRYREFSEILYQVTGVPESRRLPTVAAEAGVGDTVEFKRCITSDATSNRLRRDTLAARKLGVSVTPTFLINHLRVDGYPGGDRMDELVRAVLDGDR